MFTLMPIPEVSTKIPHHVIVGAWVTVFQTSNNALFCLVITQRSSRCIETSQLLGRGGSGGPAGLIWAGPLFEFLT